MEYFGKNYTLPQHSIEAILRRLEDLEEGLGNGPLSISGAEIEGICREEAMRILREEIVRMSTA